MDKKILNFILISVYHTKADDKSFYFWRPNNAGYTRNLNEAGNYTNSPKIKNDTLYHAEGYHNTLRTLPVLKDSDLYLKLEKAEDGKYTTILNNEHNCRLLGIINGDGNNLKRGRH